ncbi:MAG: glutathione peroxidase [Vicinamibacterales bacterium]|nr:glutathione peroxidase [Vicinamibacterales bacterium]
MSIRRRWPLVALAALVPLVALAAAWYQPLAGIVALAPESVPGSVYDLTVEDLGGHAVALDAYAGHVALVVNVASECSLATQYPGIEALYQRYRARGFVVLGFPSNDFGGQEPGTSHDIRRFCHLRGVTFPVFARTGVRPQDGQSPVYALLTATGPHPAWNFAKYLVGRDGRPRAYFGSFVAPHDGTLASAIESALSAPHTP